MLLHGRLVRLSFVIAALLGSSSLAPSLGAQSPPPSQKVVATAMPAPLLPESFAGFVLQGKLDETTAPGTADPGNAQVRVVDGFRDFASGSYKSNVNRVTIRATRFADPPGAFAAYTDDRVPV